MGKKGLKAGAIARVIKSGEMVYIIQYRPGVGYSYYTVPIDKKDHQGYPGMPYTGEELEPVDG